MEQIINYVKPELIVVAAALYILGMIFKGTEHIPDKYIPVILGIVSIIICGLYVVYTMPLTTPQEIALALFTAIVQGLLVVGLSTYVNQVSKQLKKDE